MPPRLIVEIVGDTSGLEKSFHKAGQTSKSFSKSLARTAKFAAGAAGIGTLTVALTSSFREMQETQKAAAQTAAVLKSTGGVAGVSAKHVDELATQLLNLTGIDDETVRSAENLLLTFTNIGRSGGVFDTATKAVVDMSVALGEDMQTAAVQVGKALQDPIRGVTALRRVGVEFTDAQREQIKQLVKTGKAMEAQKLILAELRREFGGSAKAAGQTLGGQLSKLRETLLNLGAAILLKLAPAITKMLEQANKWLSNARNQQSLLNAVQQAASAVAAVFKVLRSAFEALNKITGSTKRSLELLLGVLIAFKTAQLVGTFAGVAANIGLIGTRAKTSRLEVARLGSTLAAVAGIGVAAATVKNIVEDKGAKHGHQDVGGFLHRVPVLSNIVRAGQDVANAIVPPPRRDAGTTIILDKPNFFGITDVRAFEQELLRRQRRKPTQTRGRQLQ